MRNALPAAILAATSVGMICLGLLIPLAVAPFGILMGVLVLVPVLRERQYLGLAFVPMLTMAALIVWALVSAAWALDAKAAIVLSLKTLGSCLAGAALICAAMNAPPTAERRVFLWLMGGLAIALVILTMEALTHNGVSDFYFHLRYPGQAMAGLKSKLNRGATIVCMMIWPAAALLWRRVGAIWTVIVLALASVALMLGDSMSTRMALLGGAGAAGLMWIMPRMGARIMMVVVAAIILLAPVAANYIPSPHETIQTWRFLPTSAHHRLTIWGFTGKRIAEHPIRGWGMEASRDIPGGEDEIRVNRYGPHGDVIFTMTEQMLPLHPHNAMLQWWLELGMPGALGMTVVLTSILAAIARQPAPAFVRATLAATFTTGFIISAISYGFWQSWWQGAIWMTAALGAFVVRANPQPKTPTAKS